MSPLQIEFEKKFMELGLSFNVYSGDFYTISIQTGSETHFVVQLISSLPVNKQAHGSKNGNNVLAIGLFKFKLPTLGLEPDILVFPFQNTVKNQVEYIIIPTDALMSRLGWKCPNYSRQKSVELTFWLMQDRSVYETTNISVEAEWYLLSKGVNGRLADRTDIDYTKYLNSWRRVTAR